MWVPIFHCHWKSLRYSTFAARSVFAMASMSKVFSSFLRLLLLVLLDLGPSPKKTAQKSIGRLHSLHGNSQTRVPGCDCLHSGISGIVSVAPAIGRTARNSASEKKVFSKGVLSEIACNVIFLLLGCAQRLHEGSAKRFLVQIFGWRDNWPQGAKILNCRTGTRKCNESTHRSTMKYFVPRSVQVQSWDVHLHASQLGCVSVVACLCWVSLDVRKAGSFCVGLG